MADEDLLSQGGIGASSLPTAHVRRCCDSGQHVAIQDIMLRLRTSCCDSGQHVATQDNMLQRLALVCPFGIDTIDPPSASQHRARSA
jgi:hypothetical protein